MIKVMMITFGIFSRPSVSTYAAKTINQLSKFNSISPIFLHPELPGNNRPKVSKKVVCQTFPTYRLRDPRNILTLFNIYRKIKYHSPDIIHIQCGHSWLSFLLPFIRNYVIVSTIHDAEPHSGENKFSTQFGTKAVIHSSDGIIVHGNEQRKVLCEKFKLEESKVYFNHLGFHGDSLSIFSEKVGISNAGGEKLILFHGRIFDYKGLDYLIKAEPYISEEISDYKIVIAGKSKDFRKYDRLMINKNRFTVLNRFIENDELIKLFNDCTLVVLPYTDATQSGIVPIAYKFKKPVVVTDVGSLRDVVEDGKTGLIVPPKNPALLAKAIVRIINNPKIAREFGINGYKKMQSELSSKSISLNTLKIYKEILTRKVLNDKN